MTPGIKVTFPREEPIVSDDGTLHRTDTWTQEGEVVAVRPDGRIEVTWDDRHWGPAVGTFAADEITPVLTTEEKLAKMWANAKAPDPEPEPEPAASAWPAGTRVRVAAMDPDWGYAGAGHPVIGSEGTISPHLCPVGKSSVAFRGDDNGDLHFTDGCGNTGRYIGLRDPDEEPITLFFPDECLEVVP